jgi:hypothetical protein
MTTITTQTPQPKPTVTLESTAQVAVTTPTTSIDQPYLFTEGPPPEDNKTPTYGLTTSGLPAPNRSPELTPSMTTGLGNVLAMSPTEAANATVNLAAMQEILMRMAIMLRSNEMQTRDSELETKAKQTEQGIAKGLEAAKTERNAAMVQAGGQAVGGLSSMVGGFKGEGVTGSGVAVGKFSGGGTVISSSASIVSANLTYSAALDKAAQQRADLEAEQASNRANQASERGAAFLDAFKAFREAALQTAQAEAEAFKRTFA